MPVLRHQPDTDGRRRRHAAPAYTPSADRDRARLGAAQPGDGLTHQYVSLNGHYLTVGVRMIPPMYLGRRGRYDGIAGVDKRSLSEKSTVRSRGIRDTSMG
jgi:hypothetical protein